MADGSVADGLVAYGGRGVVADSGRGSVQRYMLLSRVRLATDGIRKGFLGCVKGLCGREVW